MPAEGSHAPSEGGVLPNLGVTVMKSTNKIFPKNNHHCYGQSIRRTTTWILAGNSTQESTKFTENSKKSRNRLQTTPNTTQYNKIYFYLLKFPQSTGLINMNVHTMLIKFR